MKTTQVKEAPPDPVPAQRAAQVDLADVSTTANPRAEAARRAMEDRARFREAGRSTGGQTSAQRSTSSPRSTSSQQTSAPSPTRTRKQRSRSRGATGGPKSGGAAPSPAGATATKSGSASQTRRGRRGGRRQASKSGGQKPPTDRDASRPAQGPDARGPARSADSDAAKRNEAPVKAETPKTLDKTDIPVKPEPAAGMRSGRPATRAVNLARALENARKGRVMLINVADGDECRVAVVHKGRLEELFIERAATASHIGNIYKGRVTNVEPSIQAAFIDFGLSQHGFLHISDLQPQYFPDHNGAEERVGRKMPRHTRPPIQECLRRGQEVIVQVIREGVGTKGPTLTTYLSIPGRYLVMMPGISRHGVSRKIEDDEERRTMRDLLKELNLPSGIGFILRTAGLGRPKRDLQRDLNYLTRLWKTVSGRVKELKSPVEVYKESDLVTRSIRDVYTTDFDGIVVDDAETAVLAQEFLQLASPRTKAAVEHYRDRMPLFHQFGIEDEITQINMRHVPLPSGGSLVIDTTEAMVTIDVNSGRSRASGDAEENAYRTNLEAATEIARQLRLRDLGGLIICDFIDMRLERNKREVERVLKAALKEHKERAKILRFSAFGLIEMTRQRQGPAINRNAFLDCPHCNGAGLIKAPESVALDAMRLVQLAAHHPQVKKITVTASEPTALKILNTKRIELNRIESETGKRIIIRGDRSFAADQIDCACEDDRGQAVNVLPPPPETKPRHHPPRPPRR